MSICAVHADREARSHCTRCEKPMCADCERTLNGRPYCENCEKELEQKLAERQAAAAAPGAAVATVEPTPEPIVPSGPPPGLLRPLLFASAAGLVGALVWYFSVTLTDYKTGLVAIGVGWLVGFAAVRGAGGRGSAALGVASLVVAVLAMLFGEYLIVNHFALKAFAAEDPSAALPSYIGMTPFFLIYKETIGVMDFVFYAIGAYEAWKLPAGAGRSA